MRTEDEITADARDGAAFPNGAAFEVWSARWCYRSSGCVHNNPDDGCLLVGVAMVTGKTPVEWVAADDRAHVFSDYTCTEFEEVVAHATDDEPAEDPDELPDGWRPVATLPTQEGLF